MKKSLSIEEFLETRPDITPAMLEEGRLLVEAKIKGYELQPARKEMCIRDSDNSVSVCLACFAGRNASLQGKAKAVAPNDAARRHMNDGG